MSTAAARRFSSLAVLALLAGGCGDDDSGSGGTDAADVGGDLPGDIALDVDGDGGTSLENIAYETGALSLRVTVAPFGFTVRDAAGRLVFETLSAPLEAPVDPAIDAYGPPAATRARAAFVERLHVGWDGYVGTEEPWRHFDETRRAWLDGDVVHVVLGAADSEAELLLDIEVEDNAVCVRMALDGNGADELDRLGQSFRLGYDEHFFGLGGRVATVDHRGRSYTGVVEESGLGRGEGVPPGPANPEPNGATMTSIPIPFVISTAGYGLWLDTNERHWLHLGSHRPDAWRLEVAGAVLEYRLWIGTPTRVLADFTEASGRPALPPEWAFGPRRRLNAGATIEGMPEWEALRAFDIPTTVIEETVAALPDGDLAEEAAVITARVRALTQWGYRALGYASPYVAATSPRAAAQYADARSRGLLVETAAGAPYTVRLFGDAQLEVGLVDLTEPDGPAWLADQLTTGLDYGYAGWRLDYGEYTPHDAVFDDGRSGFELRNLYPVLAQEAVRARLAAVRPDDFMLVARSGYVGSAAATSWVWLSPLNGSFDYADGLPAAVRATINLGMSGVPLVGADIGGNHSFSDPAPDRELYLRWAAFASLSPAMHDANVGAGSAEAGDRWGLWRDAQTREAYAELARRHTRLAPYRRGLAKLATTSGMPLVRHMALQHPNDPATWGLDDQYYLGPALLVAPILERGTFSREAYFPAGRFVDWDNGTVIEGPTEAVVEASLERIPFFLVDGGIVPMLDASIETLAPEDNPDVIGPTDVAEWLDVRAVRSPGESSFEMADGTLLMVAVTGPVRPDLMLGEVPLEVVFTVEQTRTCDGCYLLRDDTDPPRLWLTTPLGENVEVRGQGLRLSATHPSTRPRRVRWDVILLPATASGSGNP